VGSNGRNEQQKARWHLKSDGDTAPYPWQASRHFWIEKIRHIYQIMNSMHGHGGFGAICGHWSGSAKEECIVELDRLIGILTEWKRQLERDVSGHVHAPAAIQTGQPAPPRAAHLRVAAPIPMRRLAPVPAGHRS